MADLRESCTKQIGSTIFRKTLPAWDPLLSAAIRRAYGPCSARRCQSSAASSVAGTAPFEDSREACLCLDRRKSACRAHLVSLERTRTRDGLAPKSSQAEGAGQQSESGNYDRRQYVSPQSPADPRNREAGKRKRDCSRA